MELFFCKRIEGGLCRLDEEESAHCIRVLRHREGDEVDLIDGSGSLLHCILTEASPKGAIARIVSEEAGWGKHLGASLWPEPQSPAHSLEWRQAPPSPGPGATAESYSLERVTWSLGKAG